VLQNLFRGIQPVAPKGFLGIPCLPLGRQSYPGDSDPAKDVRIYKRTRTGVKVSLMGGSCTILNKTSYT